jgi:hypothetical protein
VEKLDPRTASYLQLETAHAPMHIGGLYLFDGRDASAPAAVQRTAYVDYLLRRLDASQIFVQEALRARQALL